MSLLSTRRRNCQTFLINVWTFCSQSKLLLYRSWCICKLIRKLRRKWQIAIYFTMPRWDCFHLQQICLQNVPVKSNSVSIEPLKEEMIHPIYVLNHCRQYQEILDLLFSSELTYIYEHLHCVIYMRVTFICFIVCVLFLFQFFVLWLVKALSCLVMPIKNLNLNLCGMRNVCGMRAVHD